MPRQILRSCTLASLLAAVALGIHGPEAGFGRLGGGSTLVQAQRAFDGTSVAPPLAPTAAWPEDAATPGLTATWPLRPGTPQVTPARPQGQLAPSLTATWPLGSEAPEVTPTWPEGEGTPAFTGSGLDAPGAAGAGAPAPGSGSPGSGAARRASNRLAEAWGRLVAALPQPGLSRYQRLWLGLFLGSAFLVAAGWFVGRRFGRPDRPAR